MQKRLKGGTRCTHLGNPSCPHRLERVCLFVMMFFPTEMRFAVQTIFSGKLKLWLDFLEACVLVTWWNIMVVESLVSVDACYQSNCQFVVNDS